MQQLELEIGRKRMPRPAAAFNQFKYEMGISCP